MRQRLLALTFIGFAEAFLKSALYSLHFHNFVLLMLKNEEKMSHSREERQFFFSQIHLSLIQHDSLQLEAI